MRIHGPWRSLFNLLTRPLRPAARSARETSYELHGLRGPVEVLTDRFGVPHIYAESTYDLFFAQGYVTARDRLFQLDYNRYALAGRLCELVGRRRLPWRDLTVHLKDRTTFDVDVMLRTFGMAEVARESLALHSPEARDVLSAYAAGVSAYIAQKQPSWEHHLLRIPLAPWSPVDSLTMIKGIGFELNYGWRAVLLGAMLADHDVPEDVARVIWPHFPTDGLPILKRGEWRAVAREILATHAATQEAALGGMAGVGSNCYAVAAARSATGDALLANDTHLALTAPVPWHEVHLEGGGLSMHGFALAGVPGVAIGRTPHFTWGITAGLVQDCDLFLEQVHPDDPTRYLTPDGWQTLHARTEVFQVRGEGKVERVITESRHGPLLDSVATLPRAGYRLAVAWAGNTPGRDLDALVGMWHATGVEQFRDAMRHLVSPTFNITYATPDGRIGYVLAGHVPRRKPHTPIRPLEGWTGAWDWDGHLAFAHNPCSTDGAEVLVTANNRVADTDYPYELGDLFEPPNRFARIHARLAELGHKISLDDLKALQLDVYSAWGDETRDALFNLVGGREGLRASDKVARAAAAAWALWDGHAHVDSAGAAVGLITSIEVGREAVRRLAGEDAAFAFVEMGSYMCGPIIDMVKMAGRMAELGVDLADVLRQAFAKAVAQCKAAMGNDVGRWRWGTLHPLVCRHRLDATPLGRLFSIGPEPAAGGPDTVNRGDVSAKNFGLKVGPAMRMVASARDRDRAWTVVPGGNSGVRASNHYDDQLGLFLAGRSKAAPMSRDAIDVARAERLLPHP